MRRGKKGCRAKPRRRQVFALIHHIGLKVGETMNIMSTHLVEPRVFCLFLRVNDGKRCNINLLSGVQLKAPACGLFIRNWALNFIA